MRPDNAYPRILTDETIRETMQHGSDSYPFAAYLEDIMEFDFHCIDWHWHPELEFVYVKTGCAVVFAGSERFLVPAGKALFINAQVIHRFEAAESTVIPNFLFKPELLAPETSLIYRSYIEPVLTSNLEYMIFTPEIPWQKELIDLYQEIHSRQDHPSPELETVRLLLKLWQIMSENIDCSRTDSGSRTAAQDRARLQIMLQYIHENYSQSITLDELAGLVALSKSSILKLFNTYVRMSPIDYCIRHRLKMAAKLLDTTENSIASIARSSGFDNTGYFCRKFKEIYRVTPGQYRAEGNFRS